jgi:hypothetical protein
VARSAALYDDGRVLCDDEGLTIRFYYLWGAKRIPYRRIRAATSFRLGALRGKWRIWGSGDLTHWYNLDPQRPKKDVGIDLDVGRHVHPCVTPDDAPSVLRIITEHATLS